MDHMTTPIVCWNCGRGNDGHMNGAGSEEKQEPTPGDLSICARCGAMGFYTDDMSMVRAPDPQEWVMLTTDPYVLTNLNMMMVVRMRRDGRLPDVQAG